MHGREKVKKKSEHSSVIAKQNSQTHSLFLFVLFFSCECIEKNYCVKCEILGWEFLELKYQLYQIKLRCQLKSWNLE